MFLTGGCTTGWSVWWQSVTNDWMADELPICRSSSRRGWRAFQGGYDVFLQSSSPPLTPNCLVPAQSQSWPSLQFCSVCWSLQHWCEPWLLMQEPVTQKKSVLPTVDEGFSVFFNCFGPHSTYMNPPSLLMCNKYLKWQKASLGKIYLKCTLIF